MSNQSSLEAATQDRKARLAQLKSLKRKQPQHGDNVDNNNDSPADAVHSTDLTSRNKRKSPDRSPSPEVANTYLSGRNYDPATRGPKLGFENAPNEGQVTLEEQAEQIAEETRRQAAADDDDKPLDLFKLQPKKPNWDLKRDLLRKLEPLGVRTDNAIARIVRERVEKAQNEAREKLSHRSANNGDAHDAEAIGMDGASLVEATREREREEAEDERRERDEAEFS